MAAPAFGAAGTYLTGGSGTSAAIAVPTGVTPADIVLAMLYIESTAAVTPPAGFTECTGSPISATSLGAHTLRVFWKRASGSDSGTYSFTWTGSAYREASAQRYTGCVASGDPFDTGSGAPNSAQRSSDATATPAVTLTTQDVDRLLVFSGTNFTGGAWTPPTSFTERADNSADLTVASLTKAAAGTTGSVTGTCASSGYSTAWMGALLPVPSGGTLTKTPIRLPQAVFRAASY